MRFIENIKNNGTLANLSPKDKKYQLLEEVYPGYFQKIINMLLENGANDTLQYPFYTLETLAKKLGTSANITSIINHIILEKKEPNFFLKGRISLLSFYINNVETIIDKDLIKQMIQYGFDPNFSDFNGRTAVHICLRKNMQESDKKDILEIVLPSFTVDLTAPSESALGCLRPHLSVRETYNPPYSDGRPLNFAFFYRHFSIAKMILEHLKIQKKLDLQTLDSIKHYIDHLYTLKNDVPVTNDDAVQIFEILDFCLKNINNYGKGNNKVVFSFDLLMKIDNNQGILDHYLPTFLDSPYCLVYTSCNEYSFLSEKYLPTVNILLQCNKLKKMDANFINNAIKKCPDSITRLLIKEYFTYTSPCDLDDIIYICLTYDKINLLAYVMKKCKHEALRSLFSIRQRSDEITKKWIDKLLLEKISAETALPAPQVISDPNKENINYTSPVIVKYNSWLLPFGYYWLLSNMFSIKNSMLAIITEYVLFKHIINTMIFM